MWDFPCAGCLGELDLWQHNRFHACTHTWVYGYSHTSMVSHIEISMPLRTQQKFRIALRTIDTLDLVIKDLQERYPVVAVLEPNSSFRSCTRPWRCFSYVAFWVGILEVLSACPLQDVTFCQQYQCKSSSNWIPRSLPFDSVSIQEQCIRQRIFIIEKVLTLRVSRIKCWCFYCVGTRMIPSTTMTEATPRWWTEKIKTFTKKLRGKQTVVRSPVCFWMKIFVVGTL